MKCLCNILGDPNHCQVTDYTFELIVRGDQYFELCTNRVICNPVTDDMDVQKLV